LRDTQAIHEQDVRRLRDELKAATVVIALERFAWPVVCLKAWPVFRRAAVR
jgi:hypothetical protein